jgi:Big-like domain-containing protein/PKD domain-containing protein
MLRILNIARIRRHGVLGGALAILAIAAACQRVPLLAPSGSTITLTALATALPVNGTTQLIAQVIEPAGTPPHSGTHVIFTTSLGTIEPSEAQTDISGRAVVTFKAGGANGTATITAASGGATVPSANVLRIPVGTAGVGRVVVSANPTLIPASGGTSVITASVSDINGNALTSAQVAFSTDAGAIDPAIAVTDASGIATARLTTSTTATVTASVGAQGGSTGGGTGTGGGGTGNGGGTGTGGGTTTPAPSGQASGQVRVSVASAPGLVITPPTTPPSAGLPAAFTFAVTVPANGSAIRDLTVDWGDGRSDDLGAVSGTATVSHVYGAPGTYSVRATLTDAIGTVVTNATSVTVVPVQKPGIVITQSPNPGKAGTVTTLTIQVTVPTGIGIQDMTINFGDGQSADLGGQASASVPHIYNAVNTYTVTVTVLDTAGQTTIGTAIVSIGT